MKLLHKIQELLTLTILALLPLQVRYIFFQDILHGSPWEPGTISVYAIDILIVLLLFISIADVFVHRPDYNRRRFMLLGFVGLFMAVSLISTVVSFSFHHAGIGMVTILFALSFMYCIATSPVFTTRMLSALVIGMVWSAILGLTQFFMQDVQGSTLLGVAAQNAWQLGTSVVETDTMRLLRSYGPLSHPNIFGGFLSVGILSLIFIATRVRQLSFRIIALIGIPLFIFVLLTTGSRSAFIALIIAGAYMFKKLFDIFAPLAPRKLLRNILVTVFVSIILFGFALSVFLIPRITSDSRLEVASHTERLGSYAEWYEISGDSVILGIGPNTYRQYLAERDNFLEPGYAYQPVHSAYLLILTEIGVLGFILLAAFIGVHVRRLRYLQSVGDMEAIISISLLLVLLITALFDHYWWSTHFGLLFMFFILGLASKRLLDHPKG